MDTYWNEANDAEERVQGSGGASFAVPAGDYDLISSSTLIKTGAGVLVGFYVNSTSGGQVSIYDGTDTGGTGMMVTTPAVGWHFLPVQVNDGIYVGITGTISLTVISR